MCILDIFFIEGAEEGGEGGTYDANANGQWVGEVWIGGLRKGEADEGYTQHYD